MQFSTSVSGVAAVAAAATLLFTNGAAASPAPQGASSTPTSTAPEPTYTKCGLQVLGGTYGGTWIQTAPGGGTSILVTGASQSAAYPFSVDSNGLLYMNQDAAGATPDSLSDINLYLPDDVPQGKVLLNCTQGPAPASEVNCTSGYQDNVFLTNSSNPNGDLVTALLLGDKQDTSSGHYTQTTIRASCFATTG